MADLVKVGWSSLLAGPQLEWHVAITDSYSSGTNVLAYEPSSGRSDIHFVSYLAIDHERISTEHLLGEHVKFLDARVFVLISCGRLTRGAGAVKQNDVEKLLANQASVVGVERYAWRRVRPDPLTDDSRQLVTMQFSRLNPPTSLDLTDAALGGGAMAQRWRAESGLN